MYKNKHFTALLLYCFTAFYSSYSMATGDRDVGYYAGFMFGPTSSGNSQKYSSFGGRFFAGYEANPYFSYEGGLIAYPQSTGSTTSNNNNGCNASNQRILYLDVLLKALLPVSSSGGIYSKAGVATNINLPFLNSCKESNNMGNFYPEIDLGAYFDLSEGFVTDISWNRLITGGSTKNIDLYAIGFTYHFNLN